MSIDTLSSALWTRCPWWLSGALVGLWLAPLGRIIARRVLQRAQAPLHEWQGPGGGLGQPAPLSRQLWVPTLNAVLWACAASAASQPTRWGSLLWAFLASTLVLLALMDWDSTLLPDMIVLPLALAGLFGSHAGLTGQSLLVSALSAAVVLGLLGGLAWVFRRIRGVSGIGGGDIKLLVALAAWFGVDGVLYIVFWASLITVIWNLAWRHFKGFRPQAEWPFGPSIVIAALAWSLFRPA
ncbi:prepilin peptidase [Chlorobaculum sp. 24CR]|uniref:prepilin peptidase n=1 Tax=Chlorobaculum sp. 24CR TaxID=2508878 RepID=UPI00100ABCC8|nr:A24 family peptidase [Chlorobaculum sp. 24CR]RXK80019.1 prepilin peptidase [Chlorobaculum sp. 24CR]